MEADSDYQIMLNFVKSCEGGDSNEVERLLHYVSKPNFPRERMEVKCRPPIFWACKGGHFDIVKILIERYPGCNPYCITDKGHNLLYVACARGHINVARYLNETYSISPTELNKNAKTPIFAAAYKGHFEMLKFLIHSLKCDPRDIDNNEHGDSLLHIACDKNHLDIARYLVEKHNFNPMLKNKSKRTPLHLACSSGNLSIVEYLMKELKCGAEVFDVEGCSPLHYACRNGYSDIVLYLIEQECALTSYDGSGFTPLHLGCRYGRRDVVRTLLIQGKVDPNFPTLTDQSPIEVARDNKDNNRAVIKELIRGGANRSGSSLDIFKEYKLQKPLDSIVHIFMIGHSESGKSTLVKALQVQRSRRINISITRPIQAIPHTAGVIPVEFDSPEFGKVLLYDFAGHYEFHPSHAALLEHSQFSSPPLFLLVVNLNDVFEEIKRKINYWIQFVENHSVPGASSPHIIVIGSHFDVLHKSQAIVVSNVNEYVKSRLQSSILDLDGFFPVDCRAATKQNDLRSCLKQSCNYLHVNNLRTIDPACHVLSVILHQYFEKALACTVHDVIKIARSSNHPLPLQPESLCNISETLSARSKFLFLRNHFDPNMSWIVLDIDALLHTITGKIFAPKNFPEYVFKATQTGVLPWSELTKHFPDIDSSLIVTFLGRLEFCQVISDTEVLDLIEGKKGQKLLKCLTPSSSDSEDDIVVSPTSNLPIKDERNGGTKLKTGCQSKAGRQDDLFNISSDKDGPSRSYDRSRSDGQTCFIGTTESDKSGNCSISANPIFTRSDIVTPFRGNPIRPHNMQIEAGSISCSPFKSPGSFTSLELKEKYLFFPGLISPEQPKEDMWSSGNFEFYSGWCLQCVHDQQFFDLRFLQTLLLRLSFTFAVSKSANGICEQLECTLWKNGLRWLNLDGMETIVEVVEDCKAVLLLIRMKNDSVMKGLRLRAAIIKKILDTKRECCLRIKTAESLINPSYLKARCGYPVINQPIEQLKRYDITLIARTFCEKHSYVSDIKKQDLIKVGDIIYFDPYMCLGQEMINELNQKDGQNTRLTQEFLLKFSYCYPKRANKFADILLDGNVHQSPAVEVNRDTFNPCFDVLCRYWESGTWTVSDFKKKLDLYSIFCGQETWGPTSS